MRILLLAALVCLSVIYVNAGPIQKDEQKVIEEGKKQEDTPGVFVTPVTEAQVAAAAEQIKEEVTKPKETGRQSPSSSDDDDDDDDDDLDLGVDDDDDDDDDEDETPAAAGDEADDDEDEDYFESFFDDILGDDDDDDDEEDDDDVAPSSGLTQPADAVPEAVQEGADLEQPADEVAGETDNPIAAEHAEPLSEASPAEPAVAASNAVQQQVVVQPVPADDEVDDDDDDDDDDDVEGELDELAGDDDDDDDDDETAADDDDDEDDDDDDDTDLEDVIEAKRSRAIQAQASSTQTRMPAIYIAKYNRFVDNILGRINRILGKSYDPVRVKLQSPADKSNKKTSSKVTNNKKKKNKRKNSNRSRAPQLTNKMGEFEVARSTESEAREPAFVLVSKTSDIKTKHPIRNVTLEVRASPVSSKRRRPTKNTTKNTNKNTSPSSSSNKNTNTKARATLYGLSTLRRDGDVVVNALKDYTSVKTNFLLGPLTLRVEKEFGKGNRRQLKSATATTAEMFGKLTLRIVHGGAASLHSIKVLQPKQVRVDSADNHEKTKEYMWRRSSHIASVVSRKLASAARSMLKPPPN